MNLGDKNLPRDRDSKIRTGHLLNHMEMAYRDLLELFQIHDDSKMQLLRDLISTTVLPQKEMQAMTEPELKDLLNRQLRYIKANQPVDANGSILIIFGKDRITQYGATVDPETVPKALREMADRLEQRDTVIRS